MHTLRIARISPTPAQRVGNGTPNKFVCFVQALFECKIVCTIFGFFFFFKQENVFLKYSLKKLNFDLLANCPKKLKNDEKCCQNIKTHPTTACAAPKSVVMTIIVRQSL